MQYTIEGMHATLTLSESETFLSETPNPDGTRTIRVLLNGTGRILELQRSFTHILNIYDHEGWMIEWDPQSETSVRFPAFDTMWKMWDKEQEPSFAAFRCSLTQEYPSHESA